MYLEIEDENETRLTNTLFDDAGIGFVSRVRRTDG